MVTRKCGGAVVVIGGIRGPGDIYRPHVIIPRYFLLITEPLSANIRRHL